MKMIRAIVRPEKAEEVVDALAAAGFVALTKMDVVGRGKQKGIQVGAVHYDELPKVMLMIVAEDESVPEIVEVIGRAAYTGNFGDGKIFISPVEEAYTIRTGTRGL
ncbi:P-II family nitrogen regulator [Desulfovirgula thermocuniculi]|uniref:P-II family nitrogen regulator n=1 Tax=Desulfovirgula thermocuniculi TaxID=348842 RepID=UPI0004001855|nr:P-II family nitrogen regulator [Desulfovirgula thermocuniculi]